MAIRIVGVDLPQNKRGEVALTYVYGIGRSSSAKILDKAGVDRDLKVKDWTDDQAAKIREIIGAEYKVEGDLRSEVQLNIKRLMDIGCYRGVRHRIGLPVRGQSTKNNARTRKGRKKTVANKKKGAGRMPWHWEPLYSTVDSIIVGNCVGKEALAAVGSTGSIVSLLIAFSQGASVGAGVIISQYMGAKRKDDVKRAVHTAMAIAVIIGLMLTVMGVFMSRLFLVWMQTPDNILDGASLYLQIYCGGLLFNVLYNMCAGIFNAAGNSKRPLLYLGAASVVNIALDLILIQGFGMGVEGAAIQLLEPQTVEWTTGRFHAFLCQFINWVLLRIS